MSSTERTCWLMMVAACLLLILFVWGLGQVLARDKRLKARTRKQSMTPGPPPHLNLDGLLHQLGNPKETTSPRQELAAVRGRPPRREHVWCAPGGEEVFLN